MSAKNLKELPKAFDLAEVMRSARFLGADLELKHYQKTNVKDYILESCDRTKYIEAHSLAIQYANEVVAIFVESDLTGKIEDMQTGLTMQILASMNIASSSFYNIYIKVKSVRGDLEHRILKDTSFLEKLKKRNPTEYKQDISKLLDETDRQFLNWAKNFPDKFTPKSISSIRRISKVNEIIVADVMDIVFPKIKKINYPSKEFNEALAREYRLESERLLKKIGLGYLVIREN